MESVSLFLIKQKDIKDMYVHFEAETYEYWTGTGKKGSAIFTEEMAKEFLKENGLKEGWVLEPTGVKTGDTEK